MPQTVLFGTLIQSASIPTTALGGGVVSSSNQVVTGRNITPSGSQFSGIVSGSGTQYRMVIPVGTNLYAT